MTTAPTICFRGADWVIGWDSAKQTHCYFRNADLAFRGDTIVFAGPGSYDGTCEENIRADGFCLMPGLVDIHNHSASMPTFRGIREELGNPNFYFSGLYEGWGLFMPDPEDKSIATTFALCELLRSGVTTYVDMCYPFPGWVETVAASGIRAYVSPLFDSAHITARNDHQLEYVWAKDGGMGALDGALDILKAAETHPSRRLHAMMSPMAVDSCTPELLRRSHEIAVAHGWPFHLHAGQAVMEFLEMTRRTGKTQIQWLHELGVLGPSTIIGHGVFLDHHSWLHWHSRRDIGLLVEARASISHCPVVLSRYGVTLESFGRYLRAGVNIGIGTDTHPHNMLEEMRAAAVLARVADQHMFAARTADIFYAATIGGARALQRDDIGRLSPGAKADIVVLDLSEPTMQPVYDPIRCLVYSAADRAVRDVYVGGHKVVSERQVQTIAHQAAAERLSALQRRVVARLPQRDRRGRRAEEVAPLTYEIATAERGRGDAT